MKTAKFIFIFDNEDEARIVAGSLSPETKHKIPKTDIETSLSRERYIITIKSPDISSLRAACNSYLRWINTAVTVKKIV